MIEYDFLEVMQVILSNIIVHMVKSGQLRAIIAK